MHWENLNAIECCKIRMMSGLTWIWIHNAQSFLTPQIGYSIAVLQTHTPFASWNCVCPCKEFLVLREGSFMAGPVHVLVVHHVHIMITCTTTKKLHHCTMWLARVLVIYTLTCTAHAISPPLQPFWTRDLPVVYDGSDILKVTLQPYNSNLKVSVEVSLHHNNTLLLGRSG